VRATIIGVKPEGGGAPTLENSSTTASSGHSFWEFFPLTARVVRRDKPAWSSE
jgi:hypothetical protein